MKSLNEVKKALYKEKPFAEDRGEHDGGKSYRASTTNFTVSFFVPTKDMGIVPFENPIGAQLLIRWITDYVEND